MNKSISVMLIDDNKIDLFIHSEFIKQMNISHTILEYSFATEALFFLRNNEKDKWPNLILLDIHMPIMNGFDFLDKYAELPLSLRENCKIIVVSSSLDTGDKIKSKESPYVLELIEKPMNTDKLKKILVEHKVIQSH
jgi:response regulator of citrate/malate metabolism